MIKFEIIGSTSFTQEAQSVEKNHTLASNLSYSTEENYGPAQLGNTLVSLF